MQRQDATDENTDILANLSYEMSLHIVGQVDTKSAAAASTVSTAWSGLFNDKIFWVSKIKRDFHFSSLALSQFDFHVSPSFYRQLYTRLHSLIQKWPLLPANLRYLYQSNPSLVVACCGDHVEHMKDLMPPEQKTLWQTMALMASSNQIAKALSDSNESDEDQINFFYRAVEAGNLTLVRELLPAVEKNSPPEKLRFRTLTDAVLSGNIELVLYIIDFFKQHAPPVTLDMTTLNHAARSGNLRLTKYLLTHLQESIIDFHPGCALLEEAAASGQLELVQYLFEHLEPEDLVVTQSHFESAAQSGNMAITLYLLEKAKPAIAFIENIKVIVEWSVYSGNVELMLYWLDYAKNNALDLDDTVLSEQPILELAFASGSIEMVDYLISRLNDEAKPYVMGYSIYSNNMALIQHLLNPAGYNYSVDRMYCTSLFRTTNADTPDIKHLLLCKASINEALPLLVSSKLAYAELALREAYSYSPIQFYSYIEHVLRQPEHYQINEAAHEHIKQLIVTLAEEAVEKSLPRVERERAEQAREQFTCINVDENRIRLS